MAPELVDRIDLSLTRLDVIAGTVPLFGDLSGELCQPGVNKATAIAAVIEGLLAR